MTVTISRRILALLTIVALGLAGCGWFGDELEPTVSPTPTTPSATPSTATPEPTGTGKPEDAVPTVADLEQHLDGIVRSAYRGLVWSGGSSGVGLRQSGKLTCEGHGRIKTGTAIQCEWRAVGADQHSGPVYVSVLDDSGRYAFRAHGSGAVFDADPGDYPVGVTDCRTLASGPPGSDYPDRGLAYGDLLYFWMAAGSPASMDDDGNGLPCETVYPAEVVARVASSPLAPNGPTKSSASQQDLIDHLQAVLDGVWNPGTLAVVPAELSFSYPPDPGEPAVTGTAFNMDWEFDVRAQSPGVEVTVLDDSGRYAFTLGTCCGAGPSVYEYSAGATCKQLSKPPTGSPDGRDTGLDYGSAVFYWMIHGSPENLDGDGNGKPCQDRYPATDVSAYFNSELQP